MRKLMKEGKKEIVKSIRCVAQNHLEGCLLVQTEIGKVGSSIPVFFIATNSHLELHLFVLRGR